MKKLILIGAACMTAVISQAQVVSSNGVVSTVTGYLSANTNALTATNWTGFAAYSRISGAASKNGGTIGAVYYLNPYVGTQIRLQYIDTGKSKWFLPNGTITLQSAYRPLGESFPITLRPLVEAGVAADFNANMYAIVGAGSELDLYVSKSKTSVLQRVSAFAGIEQWQGQSRNMTVRQYGAAVNLNATKLISGISTWTSSLFSKL